MLLIISRRLRITYERKPNSKTTALCGPNTIIIIFKGKQSNNSLFVIFPWIFLLSFIHAHNIKYGL